MIDISPELGEKYQRFGKEKISELLAKYPYKEKIQIPTAEKKKEQVNNLITYMKVTLKVERQFPKHPHLDLFYTTVAEAIWDACNMLRVPIPPVRLLHAWEDTSALEHDDTLAAVNPVSYTFFLSPRLMNQLLANDLFGYMDKYELISVIFHEIYHLWQAGVFNEHQQRLINKGERLADKDPKLAYDIKATRKEEFAAILFQKKVTEHIQTKGLKQFLSKMMVLLMRRIQLQEFYQYREKVKRKKAAFDEKNKT